MPVFIKVHPQFGGECLLNPEGIVWIAGCDRARVTTADGEKTTLNESVADLLALIKRAEEKRRSG